jgi:hypothetical protein
MVGMIWAIFGLLALFFILAILYLWLSAGGSSKTSTWKPTKEHNQKLYEAAERRELIEKERAEKLAKKRLFEKERAEWRAKWKSK